MSDTTILLHGTALSGHTHRAELMLSLLSLPYRRVDAPDTVRRTPEFLAMNPLGQIPVIEDGEVVLADSNAILVYLAKRYDAGGSWLPEDPASAAAVQRWLSVAAGEVMYGPAMARMVTLFGATADPASTAAIAARLLSLMETHLATRNYLAGEAPTIADVACYSYVAHAPEGRISLEPYPAIQGWLGRVEALPRFKPMPRSAIPDAA
ncbi:glutathione S-transferase [Microvirga sp. GCM10011540]|uniref:glutathione S-transferase n=1 Tax=Microvirga sp. GCM10011540 TaxID=3317338 RepID=UPI003606A129